MDGKPPFIPWKPEKIRYVATLLAYDIVMQGNMPEARRRHVSIAATEYGKLKTAAARGKALEASAQLDEVNDLSVNELELQLGKRLLDGNPPDLALLGRHLDDDDDRNGQVNSVLLLATLQTISNEDSDTGRLAKAIVESADWQGVNRAENRRLKRIKRGSEDTWAKNTLKEYKNAQADLPSLLDELKTGTVIEQLPAIAPDEDFQVGEPVRKTASRLLKIVEGIRPGIMHRVNGAPEVAAQALEAAELFKKTVSDPCYSQQTRRQAARLLTDAQELCGMQKPANAR